MAALIVTFLLASAQCCVHLLILMRWLKGLRVSDMWADSLLTMIQMFHIFKHWNHWHENNSVQQGINLHVIWSRHAFLRFSFSANFLPFLISLWAERTHFWLALFVSSFFFHFSAQERAQTSWTTTRCFSNYRLKALQEVNLTWKMVCFLPPHLLLLLFLWPKAYGFVVVP